MRSTQPITITLPHDLLRVVREKVASGEYASDSEVIRDGLRALQARDDAVDRWLRDEVTKSAAELRENPDTAVPAEEIAARVKGTFRKAQG